MFDQDIWCGKMSPGAFSSNKGDDFRIVLEELAKVKDKDAVIPMPDGGKWTTAGCIVADGYSIAWRVLDAQFWGVPQRRRRIALVADFGGQSAPEILFVRKSVSGDTDEGKPKRKKAPSNATGGIGADDRKGTVCYGIGAYNSEGMKSDNPHSGIYEADTSRTLDLNGGNPACNQGGIVVVEPKAHGFPLGFRPENVRCYEEKATTLCNGTRAGFCNGVIVGVDIYNTTITGDKSKTLNSAASDADHVPCTVYSIENHPADSRVDIDESGKVQTLTGRMGTGGGNVPMVMQCYSKSKRAQSATDNETWIESDTANTLNAFDVGDVRTTEAVVYALDRASYNQGKNAQYDFEVSDKGINSPLVAKGPGAVCYSVDQGVGKSACNVTEGQAPTLTCTHGGEPVVCYEQPKIRYIVRRLTPLECERLQGYPDGWTDIGEWVDSNGKKRQTSDAARYKALGNSIALPPWKWVLKRLCACYERDATMASLFDGIGGFPYLWEQINGKGTCLWASEIEEFPIAVTKARIGE